MAPSITFATHSALHAYTDTHSERHLDYIDHEASVQLDSQDAFEGPEKLLELWFTPWNNGHTLKSIPLIDIEKLLSVVNCQILSKKTLGNCDAYLLSESSLFLFPYKLILKTCGTTTTLLGLDTLEQIIRERIDPLFKLANAQRVFYSHRSFNFPHLQNHVHRSWDAELAYLNRHFPAESAKTSVLGTHPDTWHFYVNGTATTNVSSTTPDITIEILMTKLNQQHVRLFTQAAHAGTLEAEDTCDTDKGHKLGELMMRRSGLDSVLDSELKHDAFSFQPCGFSSNSLAANDVYYTVHITPEESCSYASFETNHVPASAADLHALVARVVAAVGAREYTVVACYETAAAAAAAAVSGPVGPAPVDVGHGYSVLYQHTTLP